MTDTEREPIRCSFGGTILPWAGPGWNHRSKAPTTADAWSRLYQRWLDETRTVPSIEAIVKFHDVARHIPHNHCNFC